MMECTFEQQQELNRIRNGVMGKVCAGLTTAELNELNPNLLRAAPKLYKACKELIEDALYDYMSLSQTEDEIAQRQGLINMVEQVLAKAEGK